MNKTNINKRSISLNDITSYLKICKSKVGVEELNNNKTNENNKTNVDNNILLFYYLDYIRNYSTLTNDMIKNIVDFNDENKMKIINELVAVNTSLLDFVYEGCDDDKD